MDRVMILNPQHPEAIMHFYRRDELHRFGLEREVVGCEVNYRDYMAMIRRAFNGLDSIHPPSSAKIHPNSVR